MKTAAFVPAALAAFVILAPSPAMGARVTPGPVTVTLPQMQFDEASRLGETSQLLVTPSYHIDLAQTGDIVWRGRLTRSGRLSFPVAKQTWPEHQLLKNLRIAGMKGTLSPKGKVVLTGKVKATVMGCQVVGPVRLSSAFNPGLGLPFGTPYRAKDGSFAVMSTSVPLTRTGSGCGTIPGSVSVFLKGTLR